MSIIQNNRKLYAYQAFYKGKGRGGTTNSMYY